MSEQEIHCGNCAAWLASEPVDIDALTRERDELRAALREANGFRVLAEALRYGLDGANDVIALTDAFREDFDTLTNQAAGGQEA